MTGVLRSVPQEQLKGTGALDPIHIRFGMDQLNFYSKDSLLFNLSILCPLPLGQTHILLAYNSLLLPVSDTLSHFPDDHLIDFPKLKQVQICYNLAQNLNDFFYMRTKQTKLV